MYPKLKNKFTVVVDNFGAGYHQDTRDLKTYENILSSFLREDGNVYLVNNGVY